MNYVLTTHTRQSYRDPFALIVAASGAMCEECEMAVVEA